jgi:hypothetical protein
VKKSKVYQILDEKSKQYFEKIIIEKIEIEIKIKIGRER